MIEKVGIRVSPLSKKILLARFGKDPDVALETKDASNEFWQSLVQFSFDGNMPEKGEAIEITFGGGDEQFSMRLERVRS